MIVYPLGIVGPMEIVLIALVILLIFGGKKIPELMKGLGKGVKSFKDGLKEVDDELNDRQDSHSERKDGEASK